jgi:uncharacterized protein YcbX
VNIERASKEFHSAVLIQDEHAKTEKLAAWARRWGESAVKQIEVYERRIKAVSDCERCIMGGHCIELMTGGHDRKLAKGKFTRARVRRKREASA